MSTAAPAPKAGNYEFARPQGVCHVSGAPIAPDEKFMAALRETPQGFERLDIALPAWESFDKANLLAFWQAVMPRGEVKKRLFVDDVVLTELFERLGSTDEPSKLNFRFVLGLILMRKRIVIYESTRHDEGREIWVVRLKGRTDFLDLLNPRLTEEQVAEVSQQLSQILSDEL